MFSNRSKLPKNVYFKDIANVNDEQFVFCLNFPKFEYDFCCGFSLKTGSIFLSFLFLVFSIISLINVLKSNNKIEIYTSIFLIIIYSISFLLILISTFNYSFILAYYAYLIYTIMLILNLSEIIISTIFIFCGIYVPFGRENVFVKGISFLLIGFLYVGVYLYCLWIIFCYVIHLKYNRIELVCGEFLESKESSSEKIKEEEEYNLLQK